MLKPPPQSTAIPGVTDTLDFVKNLWGSMSIPGANLPGMSGLTAPTLSTDDLDKRIADMKAVESWLNLNLTMLRGTIQAMEVQRGTLATLKSMGASMADVMRQSGVSAEKMAGMPFAPFFAQPAQASPGGAGSQAAKPAADAGAKPAATGNSSAQPGTEIPLGNTQGAGTGQPGADAAAAMGMPAALAWWNMLQEQFTQAVASAMTPAAASGAPASAASAAPDAAPDAKAGDKPAAPQAETGNPAPESGNGNGKARTARQKTDKQ